MENSLSPQNSNFPANNQDRLCVKQAVSMFNRRKVFVMGTSLAAGLIGGATGSNANSARFQPNGDYDAEIRKLFQEWKELCKAEREDYAKLEEVEYAAEKEYPALPTPFNAWSFGNAPASCICVLIEGRIDKMENTQLRFGQKKPSKRITELRALADDYKAKFELVRERHGLPAIHDNHERLVEQLGRLEEAILRTPTSGPAGVLIKLVIWHEHTPARDLTNFNSDFVISSMLDLNRLSGGIIEMPDDVTPSALAA